MPLDINPEDYTVTEEATPELWSQLEEILDEIFINQDDVTLSLLKELPNCRVAFLVRKEDHVLISALSAVFTQELVYANFYVTRKEFRSSGFGMYLVAYFYDEMRAITRPFIGKARASMVEKYMTGPVEAEPLWEIFNVYPKTKTELFSLFPQHNNNHEIVSTNKMSPELMDSLIAFDKKVTGVDRTTFLRHFIPLVRGAVIIDSNGNVTGYAATRPCRHFANKWQVAPLWAEDEEAARALLEHITEDIEESSDYIMQCRKETRGSYILEKAEESGLQIRMVASVVDFGRIACAPKYVEKIEKSLMFVANGCAAHPDA